MKAISETLYLGLLFAEQDAGGYLIPGRYQRTRSSFNAAYRELADGAAQCACIHGAAILLQGAGWGRCTDALIRAGVTETAFDGWARKQDARSVTVDACLAHFGVEVVPDEELVSADA